jgi:hypothetical protein
LYKSIFGDYSPTGYKSQAEGLGRLLKLAVIQHAAKGENPHLTEARMRFTEQELARADDFTLEIYNTDTRELIARVTNEQGKVNKAAKKLVDAFSDGVPTPDIMEKAYQQAFGHPLNRGQ